MSRISAASPLAEALIEEGLVPKECGDIVIELPVDGAVMLKYEVFVEVTDLEKLSRAFAKAAGIGGQWATERMVKAVRDGGLKS